MARVLVFAGFLGSGKTSLILGLGRQWLATGRSIAVVENEFSTRGIDGALLGQAGLTVREIVAGCVCCSLRGDLRQAMSTLIHDVAPAVICIEPTGAAGPAAVVQALQDLPGIDELRVLAVVDAQRLEQIDGLYPDYLEGLLESAQVVALTKIDAAGSAATAGALRRLTAINPRAELLPLITSDTAHLAELGRLLDRAPPVSAVAPGRHDLDALAVSRTVSWPSARTACAMTRLVLERAAQALSGAGGWVPGHIKAFIDGGDAGWWCASQTHLATGPHERGSLADADQPVTAIISVIAVGVDRECLENVLDAAIAPRLPGILAGARPFTGAPGAAPAPATDCGRMHG